MNSELITFCKPEFVFKDDRGSLTQLFGKGGWSQANIITSQANTGRGNHFHKENREMFYIIKGSFNLTLDKGEIRETYLIKPNDYFIIEKFANHSFEFLEETTFISFYDIGVENTQYKMDIHCG